MLYRKCVSQDPVREVEPLLMIGRRNLLWQFGLMQWWDLVRSLRKVCCLCTWWWAWSMCQSAGLMMGKKNVMWSQRGRQIGIHICLSPSSKMKKQWSAENAGAFCYFAAHAPGLGYRGTEGGDVVELEELPNWLWTHNNKASSRLRTTCQVVHGDLSWPCYCTSTFQILFKFFLWPILTQSHMRKAFGKIKF